jgi:hypothetical protein
MKNKEPAMTASGCSNDTRSSAAAKKCVSAHRAFVYGASIPGWGEIYAGSRLQGVVKAALVLCLGIWFTRMLIVAVGSIVGRFFDSFNSLTPFVMPDVPLLSMGISFLGIYFIWLWAVISSVDAAVAHRRHHAEPPQASILWAFAMSWFCPGSGHVYTGSRRFGYILFGTYLLGMLLVVPAYADLTKSITGLAKSGKLSANNPYALVSMVHELMVKVNFSFGRLFPTWIRFIAIAGAICELRRGLLESDSRWSKPSIGYGLALVVLGWFCPGAGQLLQKRFRIGYCVLAGYIVSKLVIGFLLGNDLITTGRAETLEWISVLIQWGAMLEALFQMIKGGQPKRLSN